MIRRRLEPGTPRSGRRRILVACVRTDHALAVGSSGFSLSTAPPSSRLWSPLIAIAQSRSSANSVSCQKQFMHRDRIAERNTTTPPKRGNCSGVCFVARNHRIRGVSFLRGKRQCERNNGVWGGCVFRFHMTLSEGARENVYPRRLVRRATQHPLRVSAWCRGGKKISIAFCKERP